MPLCAPCQQVALGRNHPSSQGLGFGLNESGLFEFHIRLWSFRIARSSSRQGSVKKNKIWQKGKTTQVESPCLRENRDKHGAKNPQVRRSCSNIRDGRKGIILSFVRIFCFESLETDWLVKNNERKNLCCDECLR